MSSTPASRSDAELASFRDLSLSAKCLRALEYVEVTMYNDHSHYCHWENCQMDRRISKSKFKPRALEYMREVEESGISLIITDRGHPVLKLQPYYGDEEESRRALRKSVIRYADPTEPVDLEAWKALD